MEKRKRLPKALLPTAVLFVFIALLIGLAFLPTVRGGAISATAYDGSDPRRDAEAMRVLGCCRAYAAAHDFQTELDGKIKARVFGIPYTLAVHGGRTVGGDEFCDVQECVSAIVKKGLKRQCADGKYSAQTGVYKNKAFVYGEPTEMPRNRYVAMYGMPSVDVCKYDTENSVTHAECAGDGVYKFTLDPRRATAYSRNEIKTLLDCADPEYESIELVLVSDGERALELTAYEKFRVNKFGGTHCTLTFTEKYSYAQA